MPLLWVCEPRFRGQVRKCSISSSLDSPVDRIHQEFIPNSCPLLWVQFGNGCAKGKFDV
jgi:hypothetical protein